jgi:hypothetical protein
MSTVIVGAGPRIATHGGRRGESKVPITPPTLITVKVGGQVQPLTPTTPIQSQRVVANNKTTTCGCGASDVLQENHPPRVAAGSGGSKCRHGGVNKGERVGGEGGGVGRRTIQHHPAVLPVLQPRKPKRCATHLQEGPTLGRDAQQQAALQLPRAIDDTWVHRKMALGILGNFQKRRQTCVHACRRSRAAGGARVSMAEWQQEVCIGAWSMDGAGWYRCSGG